MYPDQESELPMSRGVDLVASPKKQSEIDRESGRVAVTIEELDRLTNVLEGKLGAFLRPPFPQAPGELKEDGAGTSHGQFLQATASKVANANRRLSEIIERLAV